MPDSSDSFFDLNNIERYEREHEAVRASVAEQKKRAEKRLKTARRVMTYGPIAFGVILIALFVFLVWV